MTLVAKTKPVVNIFDGKSVSSKSEAVRNQAIYDQLVVCDAQVPLDGICCYLPTDDANEDLIWFNQLATDLFQELEGRMKGSILKVNTEVLVTQKKQT